MSGNTALSRLIYTLFPFTGSAVQCRPAGGGDTSQSYILNAGEQHWFLKTGTSDTPHLEAEYRNLQLCYRQCPELFPEPLGFAEPDDRQYLLMTFLPLYSSGNDDVMGRALASMHRILDAQHGLDYDNYIGLNRQSNTPDSNWPRFWWQQRMQPMLDQAQQAGYFRKRSWQALQNSMQNCMQHQPVPSLLHGDLWSGNKGFTGDGQPKLFDPACYYGDRETDLAMTRLFGGFSSDFYQAYEAAWPLAEGHEQRQPCYILYHVLNHLILFGSAYLSQAERLIDRISSAGR